MAMRMLLAVAARSIKHSISSSCLGDEVKSSKSIRKTSGAITTTSRSPPIDQVRERRQHQQRINVLRLYRRTRR